MTYLNPMTNSSPRKLPSSGAKINVRKQPQKHKTHSNKKHDIKIHLEIPYKNFIRMQTFGSELSETKYCTDLLLRSLYRHHDYPEIDYHLHEKFVHVKVRKEDYKTICLYAIEWDCTPKQAANRIFQYCIKLEMGEVVYEGF